MVWSSYHTIPKVIMGFWYIPYHTKSQAIPKLILVYQNIFGMANISTVETIFARLIPSEDVYPYVQHAHLIQLVDLTVFSNTSHHCFVFWGPMRPCVWLSTKILECSYQNRLFGTIPKLWLRSHTIPKLFLDCHTIPYHTKNHFLFGMQRWVVMAMHIITYHHCRCIIGTLWRTLS